ncbi:unnamed protein product [Lampetra fluviatilis]
MMMGSKAMMGQITDGGGRGLVVMEFTMMMGMEDGVHDEDGCDDDDDDDDVDGTDGGVLLQCETFAGIAAIRAAGSRPEAPS